MYKTTDIYVATALHALGYQIIDIVGNDRKVFVFDASAEEDANRYFQGQLLIDPSKLFYSFKTLKHRIYA